MPTARSSEMRAPASDPFTGRPAFASLLDPKQALAVFLSVSLTFSTLGLDGCKKEQPQSQQDDRGRRPPQPTPLPRRTSSISLSLPIALFPDNLVALVLAGSTFPDQITAAQQWLQQNSSLKGQQLMETVNQQSWDNSVKGLTQFPDVLGQMSSNLSWTSALGDAYFNVPQSVMNAVQVMRQRAYQAGNLKNDSAAECQRREPGARNSAAPGGVVGCAAGHYGSASAADHCHPACAARGGLRSDLQSHRRVWSSCACVSGVVLHSTGAMVATGLISFGVGMAVGAAISTTTDAAAGDTTHGDAAGITPR